jgi:hypothetical protein
MKKSLNLIIIIVNFIRIVIVSFKYITLYFTYPHKNKISAIFYSLVCFLSPSLANIIELLYFSFT